MAGVGEGDGIQFRPRVMTREWILFRFRRHAHVATVRAIFLLYQFRNRAMHREMNTYTAMVIAMMNTGCPTRLLTVPTKTDTTSG